MHKTSGFSPVIIIIAIATIAIIALVGWRIYDSAQNSQTTQNSQTNANQQEEAQEQNNDTQTIQTDPNEGYVVIKEWNVRFKPVDGLSGVEYGRQFNVGSYDSFAFTTKELADISTNCRIGAQGYSQLGLITRDTKADPMNREVIAHIDEDYYFYARPQSVCVMNSDDVDLEVVTLNKLKESLKTLEQAK